MEIRPVTAVTRGIEQHGAADFVKARTHTHVPGVPVFPRARIPKACSLQTGRRRLQHWLRQLCPAAQFRVGRRRQALHFTYSFTTDSLLLRGTFGDAGVKNAGNTDAGEHASSETSIGIVRT